MSIRRFLKASLDPSEYILHEAPSGGEGIRSAARNSPDLILLDLGLPDMDGVDVVRALREWTQLPIVILSARGQEGDKIAALDAGADDYLTKPFSMGELLARIRASIRRSVGPAPSLPSFEHGGLRIDYVAHVVTKDGEEVHLTPNEFKLLATLAKHAGQMLTHRQLLEEVWGPSYTSESHYLRVYMGQLRHKLEEDPARPKLLINEPGVGYRFRID